jgi:hypothetical protein
VYIYKYNIIQIQYHTNIHITPAKGEKNQAVLPAGKHTLRPGINLSQSTFGLSSLNCSSGQPCALAISQHESPDLTQYGVVLSGQGGGGGGDEEGCTTSRQRSKRTTATSRKNGKMVRYELPLVYRRLRVEPYNTGLDSIPYNNRNGNTNRVGCKRFIAICSRWCSFEVVI